MEGNIICKKNMVIILFILIMTVTVGICLTYFYQRESALADERNSLKATGTVEAKTVLAAFKVAGRIDSILVAEGSEVIKGQDLALLETREIKAKLDQADGAWEAARSQAEQAGTAVMLTRETVEAKIAQAEATAEKARIMLDNAEKNYNRVKELYASGAVSESRLDEVTAAYKAAQRDLTAAESQLDEARSATANIDIARYQYEAAIGQSKQAEGARQEAQAYLDNACLKAPLSGYITEQMLEAGEMVNAGTPVLEITDLNNTFVTVYIDETKIGRVRLQQKVEIQVDAYPDRIFEGKVVWINDAGEFAVHKAINEQYSHDIRSFEVKVAVNNRDLALKTGMTARINIIEGEN